MYRTKRSDRIKRSLGSLAERCRAAAQAFRHPGTLVVIYDKCGEDGDASEQYYGYFGDRGEALAMFDEAFPEGVAHNAFLCRTVEMLRPARH